MIALTMLSKRVSKDEARQSEVSARWLNVPEEYKAKVKTDSLTALGSPASRVGAVAAQVVAAIAAIELPNNDWQDLITSLLGAISTGDVNTRVAALQCIGYICETIVRGLDRKLPTSLIVRLLQSPDILKLRSNEILTAVVQGARRDEPSSDVQLAAMRALYNCLEFIKENFDREVTVSRPCVSFGTQVLTPAGGAKLHHAGGLRSDPEPSCHGAGSRVRNTGPNHVPLLR